MFNTRSSQALLEQDEPWSAIAEATANETSIGTSPPDLFRAYCEAHCLPRLGLVCWEIRGFEIVFTQVTCVASDEMTYHALPLAYLSLDSSDLDIVLGLDVMEKQRRDMLEIETCRRAKLERMLSESSRLLSDVDRRKPF